ncbi:MAG: hypothetical protein LBJ36_03920 [Synergistaceae bacterium]|jgi:hypothetical protein|nr:hypothetical protein [Synergistaceae bacterium]
MITNNCVASGSVSSTIVSNGSATDYYDYYYSRSNAGGLVGENNGRIENEG